MSQNIKQLNVQIQSIILCPNLKSLNQNRPTKRRRKIRLMKMKMMIISFELDVKLF